MPPEGKWFKVIKTIEQIIWVPSIEERNMTDKLYLNTLLENPGGKKITFTTEEVK